MTQADQATRLDQSCLLYSISFIANIAALASLKCGSSFCFAVKCPNRLAILMMLMWSGLTVQATSKSAPKSTAKRTWRRIRLLA
jgi:hypothetical protein